MRKTVKRVLKAAVIFMGFYIVILLIFFSGLLLGQQDIMDGIENDMIVVKRIEEEETKEPEELLYIEPDGMVLRKIKTVTPMEEVEAEPHL